MGENSLSCSLSSEWAAGSSTAASPGSCKAAEAAGKWRGRCWRRSRRSLRRGSGSAWLRGTAAGSWRRCLKMKGPQIPWNQTVPAALTPTGPAPPRPVETLTCTDTWDQSWMTVGVNPMTCSCTRGPPRTGPSPPREWTSSVRTGLWGGSNTKSVLVRRCLRTFPTATV